MIAVGIKIEEFYQIYASLFCCVNMKIIFLKVVYHGSKWCDQAAKLKFYFPLKTHFSYFIPCYAMMHEVHRENKPSGLLYLHKAKVWSIDYEYLGNNYRKDCRL